jgi:hypothetical protein
MKNLSLFIEDNNIKQSIDKFFENSICIDTIENTVPAVLEVSYGDCASIVFANTSIKNHIIEKLSSYQPELNVINCNCSIDRFFENNFNGFLVFNNLKKCRYMEIIEEIKKHKALLLC